MHALTQRCADRENVIPQDESSAALQKALKAKCDKVKKIAAQRSRAADAFFAARGLADAWASLELDVAERMGEASLPALARWAAKDVVSLKANLKTQLGVSDEKMEELLKDLAEL